MRRSPLRRIGATFIVVPVRGVSLTGHSKERLDEESPFDGKRFSHLMNVREYNESDLEALRKIHAAQNFPYEFPDLANPLFLTKIVLTDGDREEKILGAALLRLTAEAYLLLDPAAGTPRRRWQHLLALHAAAQQDAWAKGLEDVHAWLPPRIAKTFGRRLQRLGWIRDDAWTPYCRKLEFQG